MSLITIDQLLESVDLDFEPRWVTKDSDEEDGCICAWDTKPTKTLTYWQKTDSKKDKWAIIGYIKAAEFENKPWQECIYEVPRKVDPFEEYKKWVGKLCLFGFVDEGDAGYMILEKFNDTSIICGNRFIASDNIGYRFCEPVRPDDDVIYKDAVNELKGAKNE